MEPAAQPELSADIGHIRDRIFYAAASQMSREDADEIAQEVLIVLLTKFRDKTDPAERMRVAYGVLFKLRIGKWRKRQRRGEDATKRVEDLPLEASGDDPELALLKKKFAERIAQAADQLGEPCRTIFRLKIRGFDTDAIRQAIRVETANATLIAISRCRKDLRKSLGGDFSWL